jgi:hypothetical protein
MSVAAGRAAAIGTGQRRSTAFLAVLSGRITGPIDKSVAFQGGEHDQAIVLSRTETRKPNKQRREKIWSGLECFGAHRPSQDLPAHHALAAIISPSILIRLWQMPSLLSRLTANNGPISWRGVQNVVSPTTLYNRVRNRARDLRWKAAYGLQKPIRLQSRSEPS